MKKCKIPARTLQTAQTKLIWSYKLHVNPIGSRGVLNRGMTAFLCMLVQNSTEEVYGPLCPPISHETRTQTVCQGPPVFLIQTKSPVGSKAIGGTLPRASCGALFWPHTKVRQKDLVLDTQRCPATTHGCGEWLIIMVNTAHPPIPPYPMCDSSYGTWGLITDKSFC
jgi:hypothetical protein